MNIKSLMLSRLDNVERVLAKVPDELFSKALSDDMFSLGTNANIAINFTLRGYCPLIEVGVPNLQAETQDKAAIMEQLARTRDFLYHAEDIEQLSQDQTLIEKVGFKEIALPVPAFIHQLILPNFYFHLSMVYAIARANGVNLSKGDYDGLHQYPENFSFIK